MPSSTLTKAQGAMCPLSFCGFITAIKATKQGGIMEGFGFIVAILLFIGMATTTTTQVTRPAFFKDWQTGQRTQGRQILWAQVAAGRVVGDANSAKIIPASTVCGEMGGKIVPVADYVGDPVQAADMTNTTLTAEVLKIAHGLAVGDLITVTGVTTTVEYNGSFAVSAVTDADNYKYIMLADPGGDAQGTPAIRLQAMVIMEEGADEKGSTGAAGAIGCIQGGSLFENMLDDATGSPLVLPAAWKVELEANGGYYIYEQYTDTRLTA